MDNSLLGIGHKYSKNSNRPKKRISIESIESNFQNINISKEEIKKDKLEKLFNKYFNKIVNKIIQEIYNNNNETIIYVNYYDFVNKERIGKPGGLMSELLYHMCYEYSEHVTLDCHNNIMTLKTLFGNNLNWKIVNKDKIKFNW